MEQELFQEKTYEVNVTTLELAKMFERAHRHVLRKVRNLCASHGSIYNSSSVEVSTYTNKQNKQQPMYILHTQEAVDYICHDYMRINDLHNIFNKENTQDTHEDMKENVGEVAMEQENTDEGKVSAYFQNLMDGNYEANKRLLQECSKKHEGQFHIEKDDFEFPDTLLGEDDEYDYITSWELSKMFNVSHEKVMVDLVNMCKRFAEDKITYGENNFMCFIYDNGAREMYVCSDNFVDDKGEKHLYFILNEKASLVFGGYGNWGMVTICERWEVVKERHMEIYHKFPLSEKLNELAAQVEMMEATCKNYEDQINEASKVISQMKGSLSKYESKGQGFFGKIKEKITNIIK